MRRTGRLLGCSSPDATPAEIKDKPITDAISKLPRDTGKCVRAIYLLDDSFSSVHDLTLMLLLSKINPGAMSSILDLVDSSLELRIVQHRHG